MIHQLQEILKLLENIQENLPVGHMCYPTKSQIIKLKWEVEEVLREVRRRKDSEKSS